MPRPRGHAFTLVEAITAIVVLSVAAPPMLWALRQAHEKRADPVQSARALWLATEKLEDAIADRHSTTRGYDYLTGANYPAENAVDGFPGFSREVALAETAADLTTPGDGYMRITVTVSWTGAGGAARSTAVSALVTEYTP